MTLPDEPAASSRPLLPQTAGCPWEACDVVAVALVGAWLCSVVEIWPIPISPIVYLPFVLLAVGWRTLAPWFSALLRYWTVRLLFVVYAYFILSELSTGLGYAQISQSGRWVAGGLALMCLAAYARSHPVRLVRLVSTVGLLLTFSLLWFVIELRVGAPFIAWRELLYRDLYANVPRWLFENTRSGLTPWIHLLGYQIAAVAPLLALPILLARRSILVRIAFATQFVAFTLLFIAIWFSAQRAALLASVAVVVVFPIIFRTRRALLVSCLIVAAAGMARLAVDEATVTLVPTYAETDTPGEPVPAVPEMPARRWGNQTLDATLGDKFFKDIYRSELVFRLKLQQRALFLILSSPLGLERAGRTWNIDGLKYVRDSHPVFYARTIGVHNSVLAYSLSAGWVIFVPAVLMLLGVGAISGQLLMWAMREPMWLSAVGCAVVISLLNLTLLEAMTHNASLLNQEATSMVFLSLLLALDLFRRTPVDVVPLAS